jgi:trimethylamine:corrinoid methyltransferase-like protein
MTLETERKQGSRDINGKARETVDRIMKEHVPEPLPVDIEKELRSALKEIMNRYKIESLPVL